ncbi:hypothetical protein [Streptomyces violascens]|uniref:hypothetical protein n=1 Tax=Streptomyces violascens TaxID=67381 RepID=UPI00167399FC|nr:hypothetical protein [Streptomyces violascens]GGU40281.1 hypothetical protein GCM10010289_71360 [Streptomyces violascens]
MSLRRFPALAPQQMIKRAHDHASAYGASIGRDRSVSDDARAVVNWLRHQYTDYDQDPTAERHRDICKAIANRFPWLTEECERQVARRQEQDEQAANALDHLQTQEVQAREERRELAAASREAVARLRTGQRVRITRQGRVYEGHLEKIGRSKVTVAYKVMTGRDRDRTVSLHAALVDPLD